MRYAGTERAQQRKGLSTRLIILEGSVASREKNKQHHHRRCSLSALNIVDGIPCVSDAEVENEKRNGGDQQAVTTGLPNHH